MTPMTPGKVVGRRVREHRDLQGLTQSQLADRLRRDLDWSIERSMLARIESGDRQVSVDELFKLAAALETTPVLLMTPADEGELMQPLPWRAVTSSRVRAWISDEVPMWEQDRPAYQRSHAAGWVRSSAHQERVTKIFDQIAVLYGVESLEEVAPEAELEGLAKAAEDVLVFELEVAFKRQEWISHVGEWIWPDPDPVLALLERNPRFTFEAAQQLYRRSPVEEAESRILDSKLEAVVTAADAAAQVRIRVEQVLAVLDELRQTVEDRLAATTTKTKFQRPPTRTRDENPA